MASSLFGNGRQMQQRPMNNPMQMLQQFQQFKNSLNGQDPEQIVRGLLQSGKMTQDQFNQLAQAANTLQQFLK